MLLAAPLYLYPPLIYEQSDEKTVHGPVVEKFAAELPLPRVDDYGAAFAPLYHVALSPLWRGGIHDTRVFAAITLLLSAIGVGLLCRLFETIAAPADAIVCALIVGWSPYYLGPAIYFASDNPAFVASVLAMGPWINGAGLRPASAAAWSVAACLIRQFYLWMAPIFVFEAAREKRWALLLPAVVPAALVGGLVILWGGLTPPSYAVHRSSPGLQPVLYFLATLGFCSVPLLPAFFVAATRRSWALVLLPAIAVGTLYAWPIGAASDPSMWGGALRSASRPFGALAGTPVLFWLFVPLGAATVALWSGTAWSRTQRRTLAVLALWLAAQTFNAFTLDKYYQPMTLFVLAVMSTQCERFARAGRWALLGLVLLASLLRLVVHGYRLTTAWGI
jgi:hypothetical protein